MGRRRRAPKRTSKVIGFKAFHDTDADLLEWWDSIEEGERSDAIRDILRDYLFGKPRQQTRGDLTRIEADTAWLRLALTDLPGYVERVIQHVAAMQPVSRPENTVSTSPQLTDSDAARRERKLSRAKW